MFPILRLFVLMKNVRRNDVLAKRIATRLRELRHARNLTQENVRFDLEINIGRIEACQHIVSLPTLAYLCDYYEISLKDFFDGIETH